MAEPGRGLGEGSATRAPAAHPDVLQLGPWPLVGRDPELDAVVDEVLDRGRSVVLAGPAGVGKTRLAREATARLSASGAFVRSITATRSAASAPFGPLLGVLAEPFEGDDTWAALFRRVGRTLAESAGAAPVVLGVDDAHLLDDASASLVHQLAEQGDARLVVTLRAGEDAPDAVTALWRDELAERIEVQPLSRADVAALLRRVFPGADDEGTAHRLWSSTAGYPLYLRELAREALRVGDLRPVDPGVWAWDGRNVPVGGRLQELVARSLVDLDPGERAVLDLLAVGEPLPPELLELAAAGDALASCQRRGLVAVDTSAAPTVRFHHPLLGEVVRAGLGPTERARLSRRLAELPRPASVDPLRAAMWHVDGGVHGDPTLLGDAAASALLRFDPALAERLALAALAAGGGSDARITLGRALMGQERYREAEAALLPLEDGAGDEDELITVAKLLSDVRFWGLGLVDEADAGLVTVGERCTTEVGRLHILALRASIRNDAGDIDGALALTGWATDPAVDAGARIRAVTSAASSLTLNGRAADALTMCDELFPIAIERGVPRDVGRVLAQRIHALVGLGRFDEATELIAFAHSAAAQTGDDEVQGGGALVLAQLAFERGAIAEALDWLREATMVLGRFDPQRNLVWCFGLTASAAAYAGDVAAARAAADEAERLAASSPVRVHAVRVALGRSDALAAAGDRSRAAEVALEGADEHEGAGNRFSAAIAVDAAVGYGAAPAPLADRLARLAEGSQVVWLDVWRDNARAVADTDADALEAVAERFAELGARARAAVAFGQAAEAHARAGLRARATRARGRAAHHHDACPGFAAPWLGGAGSSPDPAVRLTRREREIATLAASGASNKEIAERLGVGVRTVESHLFRATTKLGVRSRSELADVLGSP